MTDVEFYQYLERVVLYQQIKDVLISLLVVGIFVCLFIEIIRYLRRH